MNPIVAAVCDCDETYVERFALYARKHYAEQVIIHTFTKLETFMEGLLKQRFHIVLLGGGFDEAKEGIRQYQIPILYLEEEVWTDVKEEEIYDGAACGSNAVYCVAEDTATARHASNSISFNFPRYHLASHLVTWIIATVFSPVYPFSHF